MVGQWLQRRLELRAVKAGRADLERFVVSLRGQSESEIALIVVVAAAIRVRLREAGHLPDDLFQGAVDEYEQATVRRRVARLVRKFQAGSEYIDAAGAMVWLHTLRSLANPDLRESGRQMWEQLERGIAQTSAALARIEALTSRPSPPGTLLACGFIPEDLAARSGSEPTTRPATR